VRTKLSRFAFLVLAFTALPGEAAERAIWDDVPRIVALGDIHGAYDNLVGVLKSAQLIDDQLRWQGGEAHLVQTGDIVDRGPRSRDCMELLMRLEDEAKRAGGRVHVLVGNHETFNVLGVLDYVSPEEFASYVDEGSVKRWDRELKAYYKEENQKVRAEGKVMPDEDEVRRIFERKYPLGYFEHREAFGPSGRYGRWIRDHPVAVRLSGVVFSHGDWTEKHATLGIDEVNRSVKEELSFERPLEGGVIFDADGPLQSRWLSKVPLGQDHLYEAEVDRILSLLGAARLVVGHTVTPGIIQPRFGGKHLSIDTGMLEIYSGGHQVGLEIVDGKVKALHPGGKVEVPPRLDESNRMEYLLAVAAVDRQNVEVLTGLVEEYRARDQLARARDVLQQLFSIPKPVPFRYRKDLGDVYVEMGERENAREQHLAYIHGLRDVIAVTPNNPALKNVLARFCLDYNIELNLAERMVREAIRDQPENAAILQSLGRIQVMLRQFPAAATTLERVVEKGGGDYLTHYHLGLAYAGLNQQTRAREAFEKALEERPGSAEALDALRRLDESGGGGRG
jgi:hypothetical protein